MNGSNTDMLPGEPPASQQLPVVLQELFEGVQLSTAGA